MPVQSNFYARNKPARGRRGGIGGGRGVETAESSRGVRVVHRRRRRRHYHRHHHRRRRRIPTRV